MKLKPLSSFYSILSLDGRDQLYYYDATSDDVYTSSEPAQGKHLPNSATEDEVDMRFRDSCNKYLFIIIHDQGEEIWYTFTLKSIYSSDIPLLFKNKIKEHKSAYKEYKKEYYSTLTVKDLYKQMIRLEQQIDELKRK